MLAKLEPLARAKVLSRPDDPGRPGRRLLHPLLDPGLPGLAALAGRLRRGHRRPAGRGPSLAALTVAILYPFVEYALHRWVLHARWLYKSPWTAKVWKRIHYDHHQNPHDLSVLFGALYTTLPPIVLLTSPVGWSIGGAPAAALAIAAGCLIFAGYEFCHCVQHLPFTPRNAWLREIKKHHLAHHFHSERGNFGITLDLVDRILGTGYASPRAVPRSATTHNLGYDEAERERYPWVARALGQRRRVRGPAHAAGDVAEAARPPQVRALSAASAAWIDETTIEPSPTADATRLIEPARASPTANTARWLLSRIPGSQPSGRDASPSMAAAPTRTNP